MDPKPSTRLHPDEVSILLALWEDLYARHDSSPDRYRSPGLTREDLAQQLVGDGKPFNTPSMLHKRLATLKQQRTMIRTDTAPAQSRVSGRQDHIGHRRDLYTLAQDELITWPSTARILMTVWNNPGHHIEEDQLLRKILTLRVKRDPEGESLKKNDILMDLNYAISKRYLNRYATSLLAEERLRCEIEYIDQLAARCPLESAAM